MPEGLSRSIGLTVVLAIPGWVVLAALFGLGGLSAGTAVIVGIGVLAVAALVAVPFALSFAAAGAAIDRLGPEAGGEIPRETAPSLAAWAIWPAAMRLQRRWRRHAAANAARLAAAEAIIAAAPDPLLLIDRQRRIVRASRSAATLIGAGAAGREPRDLSAALRDPALLAAADSVLRGGAQASVEFTLRGRTERVLRAAIARLEEPALDGAVAILSLNDVTALRQAERMRADFVANAGHELKTPLATLIGFIETLLGPARDDAAARERFLGIMLGQARRMARLVDDLLSLSRIELNEHVPPTGRVALAPVIEEVARGLELRAAERGIRIDLRLPGDLPYVQGDRDELLQVFQNLIDNAVKYGRPNSEVSITGGAGPTADQLRVTVSDQGDGIASEHLPRLTERFYRADSARSRELGGTGLGLAIVKHIVNRHRGRLEIASRPGEGSAFTVWLHAAS